VFEGERAYGGTIYKGTEHSERLKNSGRVLDFEIPYSVAEIDTAKQAVLEKNGMKDAYVRPIAWRGHVALPDSLARLIQATGGQKPTVLVSFGSPYLLNQIPNFRGAYLLAWSDAPATERAVAKALTGEAPITGRSPVLLSPDLPRGTGISVLNR